ncbi:preprotein translocase subunit SecY, partial [bacterium]|nr:preprotein translocase subunit SecY [bacterium]
YRIGTHIPIPGIDPDRLAQLFEQNQGTILEMFNMFSGGALERMSVFALNVVPYISAAIIMQLFSNSIPFLIELKKDGQAGRNKITQYTRYGTVLLAFIQASALAVTLSASGLAFTPGTSFFVSAVFSVVAGTVFLMWLGEQVSERGIGNGISIIIATSILTGIPGAIGQALEQSRQGDLNILLLIGIGLLAMVVIAIVVFIERGQRRITVNYAQRQQGRRMMQAQTSHLPFKVNMAGVIPAIFASTFLLFPASLSTWFGQSESLGFLQSISLALNPGQPLYILVFATLIISFCFIWLALTFNTKEVSDNLKRSGAYIAGIRPGEQTANYIDAVLARLTVFGAIYLTLICLLPLALINFAGVSFYFGGTSVLIIVVVLMDFMAQVQSHLMSGQYASLMKKANLKNYKR